MVMVKSFVFGGLCLLLLISQASVRGGLAAVPSYQGADQPVEQLIIQFNSSETLYLPAQISEGMMLPSLSQFARIDLQYARPMSGDMHVLRLPKALPLSDVELIAQRMAELDGVIMVEPDYWRTVVERPLYVSWFAGGVNDPQLGSQWHYDYAAGTSEGINVFPAWNINTGGGVVVAVIDTGIVTHADLAGQTVPGYDFISNTSISNDGDGRDNDPSDPGDWTSVGECGLGWPGFDSSWHGTHVAGTVAAKTNNGLGVAGISYDSKISAVRVLGKCGGLTSDIVDAIRWAAGLSVPGVPANANPADVINMSLGGSGACAASEQDAINDAINAGTTIVVAAGNSNVDASGSSPGNCNGVITVAASDRGGDKASYSNFGSTIEVSAPGGETGLFSSNGVLSTLNSGTTSPNNDTYVYYQGTSMAAPHVAGVAALIMAEAPNYTPAQLLQLLQSTSRPFPGGSSCNTSICGTGIVDATAALNNISSGGGNNIVLHLPVMVREASPGGSLLPLTNGDFERGSTGWTEFSQNGWSLILSFDSINNLDAHSGLYGVWLGGDNDEIAFVEQLVTVPTAEPYLAYWHVIGSNESSCGNDIGGVLVNGVVVDSYGLCEANSTASWEKYVVNLNSYAGQTVTLQIRAETDGSIISNLFIDDAVFQTGPTTLPGIGRFETFNFGLLIKE